MFKYFLSIAGKARLSLARIFIAIFACLYFCVKLLFGFKVPIIVYILYIIVTNLIFIYAYILPDIKFEKILIRYLNFFDGRDYLFNNLLNLYLEFYLGFFKATLFGVSFLYLIAMFYLMGATFLSVGLLSFFGFLGFFSFLFFGFYAQAVEYMTSLDLDKWTCKSEIMADLITMEAVFLPIQSYFPLKFHNNEPMQAKLVLFLSTFLDKTNKYYEQQNRSMRNVANGSAIRNFVVFNGKIIAIGGATAGGLGAGGFLLNEELKRRQEAKQRDMDRQLEREKLQHDAQQMDSDRQLEREKIQFKREKFDKSNSGFLTGLFGKNKGTGPKSSILADFFDFAAEIWNSIYLVFAGNSFFVAAAINFVRMLVKILFK